MLPEGLNEANLNKVLDAAITEDIGKGDITSLAVIPKNTQFNGVISAREEMVCAGLPLLELIFHKFSEKISCKLIVDDGIKITTGAKLAQLQGPAIDLLSAERTAINLLQHLSGIATLTRRYVDEIDGTGAILLDTRKTVPCLRELAKYATRMGGATNHRMRLDDGVLIKDNHVAVSGGIAEAVKRAKANKLNNIEVECDTLTEVEEALEAGADSILLDNMDAKTCAKAVKIVGGRVPTEASGNINLKTIRGIAETGVNFISVGKLTHSARATNIGLDWNAAS